MKLVEYVPLAIRTEKPLPLEDRMIHSCMGLTTEIGEVVTELKRMEIYGKLFDEERKANILEEIGDVMWYTAIQLDILGELVGKFKTVVPQGMPEEDGGKFGAIALMLAKHNGAVCGIVQEIVLGGIEAIEDLPSHLGMIIIGMATLAEWCGSSLEEAMEANIAKLRIRFPNAYSNEAAEARADKNGADARNS